MKTLLLTICFVCAFNVSAGSIIVHPSNADTIDIKTVSFIFLGKAKSFPNGAKVVPLSLDAATPTAEKFNDKVLNRSSSQIKAYWSKQIFTGKGQPPKQIDSDAEMIALIAANPNMIGYIEASSAEGVKVVASF